MLNARAAMAPVQVHVGVCGAGLGGLAAAIALKRGGAKVTILEAATELGEIGAGIQVCLWPLSASPVRE